MKVLVLGSTGGTGRAAVHYSLIAGHEVTAFARHPAALDLHHERLRVVAGDVMDAEVVEHAMEGQDAVIIALGISDNPVKVKLGRSATPTDVCSAGTRNAIAAMNKHRVRRMVVVSAFGVGETRDKLPLAGKLVYRTLLKEQAEDKEIQERLVRESDTAWIIVQPVGLTNSAAKGTYLASTAGETRSYTIPRADVAAFCVEQLGRDEFLHKIVTLSS